MYSFEDLKSEKNPAHIRSQCENRYISLVSRPEVVSYIILRQSVDLGESLWINKGCHSNPIYFLGRPRVLSADSRELEVWGGWERKSI